MDKKRLCHMLFDFGLAGLLLTLCVAGYDAQRRVDGLLSFGRISPDMVDSEFWSQFFRNMQYRDVFFFISLVLLIFGATMGAAGKFGARKPVVAPPRPMPASIPQAPSRRKTFCVPCGTGLEADAVFCGTCGRRVE